MGKALAEFNRGAALLEQYEYPKAAAAFERALEIVPDWTAARYNLALAYFNMQEKEKEGQPGSGSLDKAKAIYEDILRKHPDHLHARFSLGMYYQYVGQNEEALTAYEKVHQADPDDVYAAYKYAETLTSVGKIPEAIAVLEKLVAQDPGFVSSHYRLFSLYQRTGQREKAQGVMQRFKELSDAELDGKMFTIGQPYGSAGKYYMALGPDGLPNPAGAAETTEKDKNGPQAAARLLFSPDVQKLDAPLKAWKWEGGAVELPGLAVGDLDGDGDLDLLVAGGGDDGGVQVWINDGAGRFTPGGRVADRGTSPSLGDVDNDGDLDLWLGRAGEDYLLLNDGKGKFTKADLKPAAGAAPGMASSTRLLDLDADGDLDLLALRWTAGSLPATSNAAAAASLLYNNNRDGSYTESAEKAGLSLPNTPLAAAMWDDFDNDRDLDLVLFPAGKPPLAWVNDRVGRHRIRQGEEIGLRVEGAVGATAGDPNRDGNRDLLVFAGKEVRLFLNRGHWKFEEDKEFFTRHGALGGSSGQFADFDNDGDLDLLLADARRKDNTRGPVLLVNEEGRFADAAARDPGILLAALRTAGPAATAAADFNGDGRLDVVLASMGEAPQVAMNATKGGHFITLDFQGTEETGKRSRSNRSAIGARVEVKAGTVVQQFVVGTPSGATAAPPLRVHAGLGPNTEVQWLRVLWPDAVLQAELDLAAGKLATLAETQRKISSCPHLFVWNGSAFEFVSDFGGMGGLGYMVAPGAYAPPDPTEYVPLPKMEPRDGHYVLQVHEPLEEVVYFDEAKLVAVDHPTGSEVYPNEMMAVNAPPPPFEVFCIREPIEPVRVVDHRGEDVTEALRRVDRRYAGATQIDPRFHGVAEEHAIELDFGDRLARLPAGARLVLALNGWVEYGYSSTNFAAGQAGVTLKAPSIFALRDGRWVELFHEVGYPAGLRHWMTLDVTGKVLPSDRKLRIVSNMELFWDRAFLGVHAADAGLALHEVPASSADLHYFGYPREFSPDGRHPNLYDYTNVDRTIFWKVQPGRYTRYGEVGELLREADDCYAIMAPGDELTLRFPAAALPALPQGRQRSFLLKTDSYCKDMDLYTAEGDTLAPLPFHAMRSFPYGPEDRYPDTEKTRSYRLRYNTRVLGNP